MYFPERGMISNDELIWYIESTRFEIVKDNKGIEYYNTPCGFDIETSSFYENGIIDPENKRALMYVWQFGIGTKVTYGRTWDALKILLKRIFDVLELDNDRVLICYVHNLGYEFQFIRKHFNWSDVFMLDERKPVSARMNGFEFRCSMKLAGGKSLKNVSKDLNKYKVEKLVGDLDYSLIRTPDTKLTDKELGYCENDIRIILHYIQEKIETDGSIIKIPLTNTGYVRNTCRKACNKNWNSYRLLMKELQVDVDEYSQLKRAFQGGFVHANAKYVGKVVENVSSMDITSSYPSVMVLEKFPMSKVFKIESITNEKELEDILAEYCCMFDLEIYDVEPKRFNDHPISISKCRNVEEPVTDNGRIVFARRLEITLTEQDYYTYKDFYYWRSFNIKNFVAYKKQYLPTELVNCIISIYEAKTKLKGIDGEEINYMIKKNMLNSAYGMMVTDIVRDEIDYVDNVYINKERNIIGAINQYNSSIKRFLYYPWGVWVTAYARANLFSAIRSLGKDYIYADTDSAKHFNKEKHIDYFNLYNKGILDKIDKSAKYHSISIDKYSPTNRKGIVCTIGLWDHDGDYELFKTLGAKRYLYKDAREYSMRISGVNRNLALKYIISSGDPFKLFDNGLKIPEDCTGKMISTYIDDETEGSVVDYTGKVYNYKELSSIHMEPTSYELSMSSEFIKYLKGIKDGGE